jgi:hypothetical protein
MKGTAGRFRHFWAAAGVSCRGVVLYGQDQGVSGLVLQHIMASRPAPCLHGLQGNTALTGFPSLLEELATQDLFSPERHDIVHIQGAGDKLLEMCKTLTEYDHITFIAEGFGLPASSSLVRWAQDHPRVLLLPLFPDTMRGWESLAPLPLEPEQARQLQEAARMTGESLGHLCEKLTDFGGSRKDQDQSVDEKVFAAFLESMNLANHQEGFIADALDRPDASVPGLSRMLFSDICHQLRPGSPAWTRQKTLFPGISSLPAGAKARVLGRFLTEEVRAMHHAAVPLCAAFASVLTCEAEARAVRNQQDAEELRDVLSVRLRS